MTAQPGCYRVTIAHHRREPVEHRLAYRMRTWLVDVDRLPGLPRPLTRLCRFDARDHFDQRRVSIRSKLDELLGQHGIPRPARAFMLAQPRSFGYLFNPLTLFYCYDADGQLLHTVAEVRNTHGGRHTYVLTPDAAGRAHVDKAFYVSPFHPVDGNYDIRTPAPGQRLAVGITLQRRAAAPFTATMTGFRCADASLWPALCHPLATRAVMTRIRLHGTALYLKGLRPTPCTAPADVPGPRSAAQWRLL